MSAILNMANVAGSASQMGSGLVSKFKIATGLQQEQEKSMLQVVDDAASLTWKQVRLLFGLRFKLICLTQCPSCAECSSPSREPLDLDAALE